MHLEVISKLLVGHTECVFGTMDGIGVKEGARGRNYE